MSSDLPESDWKAFRKLRGHALERLCERALSDVNRLACDGTKTFHERYLEVFELIQERDGQIARAFNNPRRSSATLQLADMLSLGLIKSDELLAFTPRTRTVVEALAAVRKARGIKKG